MNLRGINGQDRRLSWHFLVTYGLARKKELLHISPSSSTLNLLTAPYSATSVLKHKPQIQP